MMKKYRKVTILVLLLSLTVLSGCIKKKVESKVWTHAATEKILLDYKYDDSQKKNNDFFIKMVKGEYESYQIIITPDNDVNNYDVEVTDFSNGDKKFGRKNITIYNQKYIEVTSSTVGGLNGPLGFYPDALLPFEKAIEYKENKIKKDQNQGIWLTFKTDENTEPGVYEGVVKVKINGHITEVKGKIQVVDFLLSETNTVKSVFPVERHSLIYGEYDNTLGMYEKYVDFLAEFRMSTYLLPAIDKNITDYIKVSKRYANNDKMASYAIPVYYEYSSKANDIDVDYILLEQYILAMVDVYLNEGIDLLSKAYLYIGIIDEPEMGGIIERANRVTKNVKDLKVKINNIISLEDKYDVDKRNQAIDMVNKIENLVTNKKNPDLDENVENYTPLFDDFDSLNRREEYQEMDSDIWWYGCIGPQNPYPTYHMDDYLVSSRIVSWMQHDYQIAGILYWETSLYEKVVQNERGEYVRVPADAYKEASRFPRVNGDGWLTYPGAPYGIDGPVSSIRMHSIRDGFEELEMLNALEEHQTTLAEKYNLNTGIKDLLITLYDQLYEGTKVISDGIEFLEVRDLMLDYLTLLTSSANILVEEFSLNNDEYILKLVIDKEFELQSSNEFVIVEELSNYSRYTYRLKMDESSNLLDIKTSSNGSKVLFDFGGRFNLIKQYHQAIQIGTIDEVAISNGKTIDDKLSDNVVKLSLTNKSSHSFTIDVSNENLSENDLSKLIMTFYNQNENKAKLNVYIQTSDSDLFTKIYDGNLKHGYNELMISHLDKLDFKKLGKIETIHFEFTVKTNETLVVYLDKLITKEQGR